MLSVLGANSTVVLDVYDFKVVHGVVQRVSVFVVYMQCRGELIS